MGTQHRHKEAAIWATQIAASFVAVTADEREPFLRCRELARVGAS